MYTKYIFMMLCLCVVATQRINAQKVSPNGIALSKALSKQDAGYSKRSKDDRYEGFYNKEKGEEDFRIQSLLKGKLEYLMNVNESLTILTQKIPGVDSVYVAGSSVNFWPDYRLDIRLKAGDEAHVPLSAAIRVKNLFQNHLGIYGYTGTVGAPDCYVPVEVRSSINKKNAPQYVLTLTSAKSVSDISWDYKTAQMGTLADPLPGKSKVDDAASKTPIIIPLIFAEEPVVGTVVVVQVWGRISGNAKRERLQRIKILIPKV